jgi:hypothetical protein
VDVADLVAAVTALRALARERLVHFAAIGLVIFAIARGPGDRSTRISLSRDYLGALEAAQARRTGVPALSGDRTVEVERRAIEDEVLYREALRLGLDRDDRIVRQHLVQKMLLLAEDLGGASREPTRAEVEAYFERTRDRWRVAEGVHLIHVFAAKRETLLGLADQLAATPAGTPPAVGDAFPRSRDVRGSRDDLAATYGDTFADAAFAAPLGTWSTPVASRFGWHLIEVVDHTPGRPAELAEVAGRVRLELAVERRHAAIATFLDQAARRYTIDIDSTPVVDYQPTRRLALRSEPSAED